MKRIWPRVKALAVITAITGFLFFSFEGATRLFFPQNVRIVDLNQETLGVRDSVLGYHYRPDTRVVIRGPEFSCNYVINEQGLRDAVVYGPKSPGVIRILLLGDSFAFGAGCEYADTWAVILEDELKTAGHKVEVVKAGMVGFDTRTEMLYLERIFSRFDPDLILVALLPNDLFTNTPVEAADPDTAFVKGSFLFHSVTLLKRLLVSRDWLYVRLYLSTGRRDFFLDEPSAVFKRQIRVTKALLLQGQRFARNRGAGFLVLSIPQQFQVLAEARDYELHGIDPRAVDRVFLRFAEEEGFIWIPTLETLATAYKTENKNLYFRYDGHLNREGSRVLGLHAAKVIGDRLARLGKAY